LSPARNGRTPLAAHPARLRESRWCRWAPPPLGLRSNLPFVGPSRQRPRRHGLGRCAPPVVGGRANGASLGPSAGPSDIMVAGRGPPPRVLRKGTRGQRAGPSTRIAYGGLQPVRRGRGRAMDRRWLAGLPGPGDGGSSAPATLMAAGALRALRRHEPAARCRRDVAVVGLRRPGTVALPHRSRPLSVGGAQPVEDQWRRGDGGGSCWRRSPTGTAERPQPADSWANGRLGATGFRG